MKAPQIIIIVLWGISLCASAYLHGKPKEDKHNFGITLLNTVIYAGLLIWGGFFS